MRTEKVMAAREAIARGYYGTRAILDIAIGRAIRDAVAQGRTPPAPALPCDPLPAFLTDFED